MLTILQSQNSGPCENLPKTRANWVVLYFRYSSFQPLVVSRRQLWVKFQRERNRSGHIYHGYIAGFVGQHSLSNVLYLPYRLMLGCPVARLQNLCQGWDGTVYSFFSGVGFPDHKKTGIAVNPPSSPTTQPMVDHPAASLINPAMMGPRVLPKLYAVLNKPKACA